jgi:hypothetical protein
MEIQGSHQKVQGRPKEATMFQNANDEERICQELEAYVQEFGAENVVVALPKTWHNPNYSLSPARLEFTTDSTIEVRVNCKSARRSCKAELASWCH